MYRFLQKNISVAPDKNASNGEVQRQTFISTVLHAPCCAGKKNLHNAQNS